MKNIPCESYLADKACPQKLHGNTLSSILPWLVLEPSQKRKETITQGSISLKSLSKIHLISFNSFLGFLILSTIFTVDDGETTADLPSAGFLV